VDQTAKDQVLQEIAALEQQVTNFGNELATITASESFNPAQYSAIQQELDTAKSKLEAKRTELATLEDVGQAAQEEVSALLEAIDIGNNETMPMRAWMNEDAYQVSYIAIQKLFAEQAQRHAQIVSALKASHDSENASLREEAQSLRNELFQAKDTIADLTAKHEAAANLLEEEKEEKLRLKADNENLRNQLENIAKPKDTNVNYDAAEAQERLRASRIPIYDVKPLDNLGKRFSAKLVETGEPIEFGYLEKGKYREVTDEEASRFRAEQAASENEPVQPSETNAIPDSTLGDSSVLEPPTIDFPTAVLGELPTESVPGTILLSPEEITSRLLALEARVDQIVGVGVVV
jgi:hypothetical protein